MSSLCQLVFLLGLCTVAALSDDFWPGMLCYIRCSSLAAALLRQTCPCMCALCADLPAQASFALVWACAIAAHTP
eukprot:scaffold301487_cov23-Tisochrysis_lutea.AAC.1